VIDQGGTTSSCCWVFLFTFIMSFHNLVFDSPGQAMLFVLFIGEAKLYI
jgi:hypothetical protein